jgi:hypothetical protein
MQNQTNISCVSCGDTLNQVAKQEQVSIFECSNLACPTLYKDHQCPICHSETFYVVGNDFNDRLFSCGVCAHNWNLN